MHWPLSHRDTDDETPEQVPPLPAVQQRLWRPTDAFECKRRTGHQFLRDFNSRLRCIHCGHRT